jgi:predicted glycogen debranching enzyme
MPRTTSEIEPHSYIEGTRREWLISNGLGGYASSTAVGANTRAYHGLLVAAIHPPVSRMLLLSSLDEILISDQKYMLSNHQYPGTIYPQGYRLLQKFSLSPFPQFSYKAGDAIVEKTIIMVRKENTTLVEYTVSGASGTMMITPLTTYRSFHAASSLHTMSQEETDNGTYILSGCNLFLFSDIAHYIKEEQIYYNFEYEVERQRGLAWKENLYCPGYFEVELDGLTKFCIVASTSRRAMPVTQRVQKTELNRLAKFERKLEPPLKNLAQAADSFLVKRGDGKSIIAGYHWFDDWGRDAMISIPGLLLVTGQFKEAKAVLKTFAGTLKDGIMQNDLGVGSYNTVDASLWFIQAVFSYYCYCGDLELISQLWPTILQIIESYSGDCPLFRMDSDALIVSGPALTWMDARVDGQPVTPRAGKACEINALWYSSLCKMEQLAKALDKPWDTDLADRVRESYQKFWNSENGCLFDMLDHEDASIRPNQIIAAAIPDLLPGIKRKSVIEVVTRELLTPYGLRTLSPRDPRYCGRYEGGPRQRDEAYHQGTVWPWLIGPYIDAFFSVNGHSDNCKAKAREILRPLVELNLAGINTIPEIFDGESPHLPGGCISQAWSVAEVMRAWSEYIQGRRPDGFCRYT